MPTLTLTPRGHLLSGIAGDPAELPAGRSRKLADAFGRGSGYGSLELGAADLGTALPADLGYWRDFAARFVTAVARILISTDARRQCLRPHSPNSTRSRARRRR